MLISLRFIRTSQPGRSAHKGSRPMDENKFWQIIEGAGSPDKTGVDEQCASIVDALTSLSLDELIAFENVRRDLLNRLYVWPVLHANFIVQSYVSDDVFEDFRHWIILNGRSRYYMTLENPNNMANYIDVEDPIEEITGEPLMFVVENAWHGDIEEIEAEVKYPEEPFLGDDWPSKKELKAMYPDLFSKFWNEEMIAKFHQ